MFSCETGKFLKNIFFYRTAPVAASDLRVSVKGTTVILSKRLSVKQIISRSYILFLTYSLCRFNVLRVCNIEHEMFKVTRYFDMVIVKAIKVALKKNDNKRVIKTK